MADETETEDVPSKKSSKVPLMLGLVLALAGGGGGFYAVQSGLILGNDSHAEHKEDAHEKETVAVKDMPDIAFVPVEPIVVSLNGQGGHLRFRAQLEVGSSYKSEVENLMPRVVDVLNNYLRALETEDLANGGSLTKLRAQMLRRVQIVTGGGRVKDLLIMEFVLN